MTDDLKTQVRGILWKHFPKAVTRQIDAPTDELMAVVKQAYENGVKDGWHEYGGYKQAAVMLACSRCGHSHDVHRYGPQHTPCQIQGCDCREWV